LQPGKSTDTWGTDRLKIFKKIFTQETGNYDSWRSYERISFRELPPPADLNETTSAMNGNREFSEFSETGIFFINHGQNRKDWL
jgi:hypothetical protein